MSDKKGPSAAGPPPTAATAPVARSSQMEAVMRLIQGKEERTIAEKLADSNRPTWEQYKKDNEDKLNLDGLDQQKMEDYRKQLDAEREKRLSRGTNHKKKKKKKDYNSSSEDEHRRKRKHKKKHKRKKKRHRKESSDESSSSSSDESDEYRKKRKKKKKKPKKSDEDSDGSHYRLSKFFDEND